MSAIVGVLIIAIVLLALETIFLTSNIHIHRYEAAFDLDKPFMRFNKRKHRIETGTQKMFVSYCKVCGKEKVKLKDAKIY